MKSFSIYMHKIAGVGISNCKGSTCHCLSSEKFSSRSSIIPHTDPSILICPEPWARSCCHISILHCSFCCSNEFRRCLFDRVQELLADRVRRFILIAEKRNEMKEIIHEGEKVQGKEGMKIGRKQGRNKDRKEGK